MLIQDHHPGYISWEQYLANERRLAANDTRGGQRPAREGAALCQGIVRCGACGSVDDHALPARGRLLRVHPLARGPHRRHPAAGRSRRPWSTSWSPAGCSRRWRREEIELALAAADEVADRRARSTRAVELRVERARYEAIRAERAFHACEPENRLVARSLETRWEQKLHELAEAEAELAEQNKPTPEPSREQLEALARDLPKLWAAESTRQRDRKRLLRAMIADVTITSQPDRPRAAGRDPLALGRQRAAHHPATAKTRQDVKRTPAEVIELIKRLAADHTNTQIAEQLDAAGLRTSTGGPFDERARAGGCAGATGSRPANGARRRADRHPDRRALRHLRRHRLRVDRNRQAHRPPRARQPALHPIRSRRRATLPTAESRTPFTYPPKPKSGLQEVQFDATVPVILDRVHQARVVNALEPEWEARFEPKSYGFRPGRGCHDAIEAIFQVAKGKSPRRLWVLDADLAGAFDRIGHDHILAMIGSFPARGMIRAWLKAGVVENGRLSRTEEGTPQGGVVSPVLLNIALHGMETAAGVRYGAEDTPDRAPRC